MKMVNTTRGSRAEQSLRRSKARTGDWRFKLSRLALGIGAGGSMLAAASAFAANKGVEEIVIEENRPTDYTADQSSIGKFTETLVDTPQSITVLTKQLMEDRGAMSLTDALRNVPGITLGAGEFSWQGNNPNIRGFNARNDMFLDGMRDFGNYDRDPFNLESVEVLQGPSSMMFGRGSTGGIIDQASKQPLAESLRSLHVNLGNADTRRITADYNEPLTSDVAFRINLLKHDGGVPGRDGADTDRYGVAPSLAMQLGSATKLTLSYMKQHSDVVPDYGLPWLAGKPANVDRSNYYGFDDDFINTDASMGTVKLDHVLNQDNRLQALVRYADYSRSTRITEPLLVGSPTATTPLDTVVVNRNVFRGESDERIFQGQLNLVSHFQFGGVEHAVVSGIEASEETSSPGFGFALGVPTTPLLHPVDQPFSSTGIAWRLLSHSDADSQGAFVLDTIKFNSQWQVVAGIRWDRFHIDYNADRYNDDGTFRSSEHIPRTDTKPSYRAALLYKPSEQGTLYLGWGTSFNPSAEGLSFINSGRNLTIGDSKLDPENNKSLEAGLKWQLFNKALDLDTAVFHIEKENARVPDPTTPGYDILAGKQTVTGFSFTATGRLNQNWAVSGGYTYLDSEQAKTTQLTVLPGTPLANVPRNSLSAWVSWTPVMALQFGVGGRYVGDRLAVITQPVKEVPGYWAFDAMAKYQVTQHFSAKLNLTNLTDKYYFDQLHPFHVVPGPGFGAVLALDLDY
ncbi:MAG TPA: TonB-dependent siderophore receptor [Candidatus Acidoferrum sp.]|nr:TonB-dependent siderophore receptor [Candidatus Acidoferrum sp.]